MGARRCPEELNGRAEALQELKAVCRGMLELARNQEFIN
jgi:hypothetical protein